MNNVAVVSGGASGIGLAVTKKFLDNNMDVVIVDYTGSSIQKVVEEINTQRLFTQCLDVADAAKVKALFKDIDEKYGGFRTLVNCAGVFRDGLLHNSSQDDYDIQFNINVKGVYNMMKYALPLMLKTNKGAIVNIASTAGIGGNYNSPIYSASKSAVIGLTKAAALDYASMGVRINAVCPTATKTPMFMNGSTQQVIDSFLRAIPDGNLGTPEQVASAVNFLCSDDAAHITGQVLAVDGGLTAWSGEPRQNKI